MATDVGTTPRCYGTFEGVFVPTLLTILGVILYLAAAYWIGRSASMDELAGDYVVMLERSA